MVKIVVQFFGVFLIWLSNLQTLFIEKTALSSLYILGSFGIN